MTEVFSFFIIEKPQILISWNLVERCKKTFWKWRIKIRKRSATKWKQQW